MKKIIILIVLFVASLSYVDTLKAQDSNWWLGGSISYWHNSNSSIDYKTNNINIIPTIGYQFNPQIAAGLKVGYKFSQEKSHGIEDNLHAFIIEPFVRFYYFNHNNVFRMFVDFEAGVAMGNDHCWLIGLIPGLEFKPVPKVCLFATCGFLGYKTSVFNNQTLMTKSKGWGCDLDSNDVTVGVNLYF